MEERRYGEYNTLETRNEAHEQVDKGKRYKEILECLNQKRGLLNRNKSKYQSLIINNNNMKTMLLKLMKIKEE